MTYQNILGTFKVRGNKGENTGNLDTLRNVAQEYKIDNIILNGYDTTQRVASVLLVDANGNQTMKMVKFGLYDFMDFTSEEDLKAYNNMREYVRNYVGAYSNKFNIHTTV